MKKFLFFIGLFVLCPSLAFPVWAASKERRPENEYALALSKATEIPEEHALLLMHQAFDTPAMVEFFKKSAERAEYWDHGHPPLKDLKPLIEKAVRELGESAKREIEQFSELSSDALMENLANPDERALSETKSGMAARRLLNYHLAALYLNEYWNMRTHWRSVMGNSKAARRRKDANAIASLVALPPLFFGSMGAFVYGVATGNPLLAVAGFSNSLALGAVPGTEGSDEVSPLERDEFMASKKSSRRYLLAQLLGMPSRQIFDLFVSIPDLPFIPRHLKNKNSLLKNYLSIISESGISKDDARYQIEQLQKYIMNHVNIGTLLQYGAELNNPSDCQAVMKAGNEDTLQLREAK